MADVRLLDPALRAVGAAPFGGPEGWSAAQALTAEACGGWATQILAFSPQTRILWDWSHGISSDVIAEFERRMGDAPELNPRARVLFAPHMRVLGDDDFLPEDRRRRNSFYVDFYEPAGAPYAGLVQLGPLPDEARVVMTVMRTRRAGPLAGDAARLLGRLAKAWRDSLQLKVQLEDRAAQIAAGALGNFGGPVFLLDRGGRVVAASPEGDAALVSGRLVSTRLGVLRCEQPHNEAELRAGLEAVLSDPIRHPSRSVVLESREGAQVAEIAALPMGEWPTHRTAAALVALKPLVRTRGSAGATLQRLYGLSPAEAEVALGVAEGRSIVEIAGLRAVSVGTLRNQLKAIFEKVEVGTQAQLASRILQRLGARWVA